jgi:cephalosporin-C deacetylase-like acetyl esterase
MNAYRSLEMQEKTRTRKEDHRYFVGTTLKNPLEYERGEKMIFKIRVKYMDGYLDIPYIKYSKTGDDGQAEEGYIPKSEDGWFYIEGSIDISGFIYIKAQACDENKQIIDGISPFNGSAGADVDKLLRATKTPDGYLEFWDMLKAEVEATEPALLFSRKISDESYPDFEIYDMHIKAPWSDYVSAIVCYPKGAEKNSLKFAMNFQGYGVRTATPMPLKGHLSISVNAHALPNCESDEFYADVRDNKLIGYGYDAEENKRPETTYWAKMILRDLQAIRYFKDHELLNKKDYYFIGSSQGGMQACNMAAHFDRSSAVILNVPWLSDVHAHELCGRRPAKMPKGCGIEFFDTAVAAEHLSCPAYIISGLGDPTCNSGTQMAIYNSIRSNKYIEFYQNKVHSFTIPWDKNMYSLGDKSLASSLADYTTEYYDFD